MPNFMITSTSINSTTYCSVIKWSNIIQYTCNSFYLSLHLLCLTCRSPLHYTFHKDFNALPVKHVLFGVTFLEGQFELFGCQEYLSSFKALAKEALWHVRMRKYFLNIKFYLNFIRVFYNFVSNFLNHLNIILKNNFFFRYL